MIDKKLREYLEQEGFNCILLENPSFDNSIVGFSDTGSLIYDFDMMTEELHSEENMSREEAVEYIAYNTMRALNYMGEHRPIILNRFEGVV